jgi:hypothetical protein
MFNTAGLCSCTSSTSCDCTHFFYGFDTMTGNPIWCPAVAANVSANPPSSCHESDAKPLFLDESYVAANNCLSGTGKCPSVGNVSVANFDVSGVSLPIWLLTYDAEGTTPPTTQGIYFRYATQPWGPWDTADGGAAPQSIFLASRDSGFGDFIHDPNLGGPAGPMISEDPSSNRSTPAHDPQNERGGTFAPLMIRNFTAMSSCALSVYYTMSTWNPYTVVKMRSDLAVTGVPPSCP